MDKTIKVSVVIPVYNAEEFLCECMDSILAQTLNEIEIICVNDGSTDGSPAILSQYAASDQRIVLIDQPNAGAGAARNRGIAAARGQYIGFVDSDDTLYPTMYEVLYDKATATNADMVITGKIETLFGDDIEFPEAASTFSSDELSLGTFRAIEYPAVLKNVFLWNRLFSLEFWKAHHFKVPEGRKFAEDLMICTQTSVLAKQIGYVTGPLYKYRNVRENSLSDQLAKSMKKLDYVIAVKETKEFLRESGQYQFFGKDFLEFAIHLFILLQQKISDYTCHYEFFTGIAALLDQNDFSVIKDSWLFYAYPSLMRALKKKKNTGLYLKNRINYILHRMA